MLPPPPPLPPPRRRKANPSPKRVRSVAGELGPSVPHRRASMPCSFLFGEGRATAAHHLPRRRRAIPEHLSARLRLSSTLFLSWFSIIVLSAQPDQEWKLGLDMAP